jgi:hypothetical protein
VASWPARPATPATGDRRRSELARGTPGGLVNRPGHTGHVTPGAVAVALFVPPAAVGERSEVADGRRWPGWPRRPWPATVTRGRPATVTHPARDRGRSAPRSTPAKTRGPLFVAHRRRSGSSAPAAPATAGQKPRGRTLPRTPGDAAHRRTWTAAGPRALFVARGAPRWRWLFVATAPPATTGPVPRLTTDTMTRPAPRRHLPPPGNPKSWRAACPDDTPRLSTVTSPAAGRFTAPTGTVKEKTHGTLDKRNRVRVVSASEGRGTR